MQVTVDIPDNLAQSFQAAGRDPARATLEALAVDGYRSGALSAREARSLLGIETRYEFEGFLKSHNVWEHAYGIEDLEHDREVFRRLEAEGRLKA
jgi:predicted HTH domain antitoxin